MTSEVFRNLSALLNIIYLSVSGCNNMILVFLEIFEYVVWTSN